MPREPHLSDSAQPENALMAGRGGRDPGADSEGSASGGSANRGNGGNPNNSTGSEPAGSAFWGTAKGMLLTRGYATDNDMNWAPTDLMRMGRPALQALKDSGLKGDGYKALHDSGSLHLSNKSIVAGAAGYMKRNGVNHNEAAKSSATVDRLKMPADMRERHRAAVEGIHTSTPENEGQRKEDLKKSGDEIVQHDPAHKAAVERERRNYKAEHVAAPKAEVTAKKYDAKAGQQIQAAQKTDQQLSADRQAAQSSKNKLGVALN